ncbi:metalloregulator ArsR/SmtB family transcription factor [Metabacillus herbersteinensis]|uniref:Metalloregulator ArsR/SmtB family transcription factor n=1 Tax=Metabacillus herbersteinensis TaxID=283816 RepID=A0ABV6GAG7_9BACI
MHLSRLVAFHKVMGDPTRIRILAILAKGPKHGQSLAGILGLTAPTITHHIAKLKEINLVTQRREKNTIYFHINETVLEHLTGSTMKVIFGKEGMTMEEEKKLQYKQIVENFLTKEGRLKTIPAQRKKKLIVLYHVAKDLEAGKRYVEKEINEYIKQYHDDFATIRREFIINGIMYRENGIYELNPKEIWSRIE